MQLGPTTSPMSYRPRRLTLADIETAMEDQAGFCVSCGAWQDRCEPDARAYKCETCGDLKVYGAEEIMLMGLVK